jgi:PTS system nitrogen regulatory IIA component
LAAGDKKMKVLDVLYKDAILTDLKANDKKGILEEMAHPVATIAGVNHQELVRVLLEREQLGSTGIGGGIGIPHGKLKNLDKLVLSFGLSRKGVDFDAMDNQLTFLFFLLITPENSTGIHLKLLARISRFLKNEDIKERLFNASNREDVIKTIEEVDEEL